MYIVHIYCINWVSTIVLLKFHKVQAFDYFFLKIFFILQLWKLWRSIAGCLHKPCTLKGQLKVEPDCLNSCQNQIQVKTWIWFEESHILYYSCVHTSSCKSAKTFSYGCSLSCRHLYLKECLSLQNKCRVWQSTFGRTELISKLKLKKKQLF